MAATRSSSGLIGLCAGGRTIGPGCDPGISGVVPASMAATTVVSWFGIAGACTGTSSEMYGCTGVASRIVGSPTSPIIGARGAHVHRI